MEILSNFNILLKLKYLCIKIYTKNNYISFFISMQYNKIHLSNTYTAKYSFRGKVFIHNALLTRKKKDYKIEIKE